MKISFLMLWLAGTSMTCASTVIPPPASPYQVATCDTACANVARLGCPHAELCKMDCDSAKDPALNLCVTNATSCANINQCDH